MATYASISTSLDGYYVGPNPSPHQPMGDTGFALHNWFAHDRADRQQLSADDILREDFERLGAMIMGRDSYEHAQAAWGPRPPFEVPVFVLTHRSRPDDVREGSTFHFVTEGFSAALQRAHDAVSGTDVAFHGGGAIQQAITHGVLDELQLHVVPVLLRQGRRLFDEVSDQLVNLEQARVIKGNGVTHLKYRVLGAD
ncbi:dihydrofolate reductase family protein [Yaniella halotolerans]|uniref:dihydrofolate reductase family protein n=1 Tax=Yaniella halotolerans TaxID=225453 RepID=UPI0003B5FD54|nr:dihydrofolate reductase family protein [Yaniella halotolerans]